MHPASLEILTKLFDSWQSNQNRVRAITVTISQERTPAYFAVTDIDQKDAIARDLEGAARCGAVRVDMGRFEMSHLPKRVALLDGMKLADVLGVPLAVNLAAGVEKRVEGVIPDRHAHIQGLFSDALGKWRAGKPALGLRVEQEKEIAELFLALVAVVDNRQDEMDLRTFSAKILGNSKTMERMEARFVSAWKVLCPESADISARELYESLGLTKFPWPMLLKGPVAIVCDATEINVAGVFPFVGIPFAAVRDIKIERRPQYVLTIENLSSFNRHVHEIKDDGLVIYTNGFPSTKTRAFLSMLDELVPRDVPFYHWGDIDVGGLRIFRSIEEVLVCHCLQPHLMSREILNRYGELTTSFDLSALQKIASSGSAVGPLAAAMVSAPPHLWLEQEGVDPIAPVR